MIDDSTTCLPKTPLEMYLRAFPFEDRVLSGSAACAIQPLLTLNGRLRGRNHDWSLANRDLGVLRVLREARSISLESSPRESAECEAYRIYFNPLGRLHIRPTYETLVDYGLGRSIEIGFVSLPRIRAEEARIATSKADRKELIFRARLDNSLRLAQENDCLDTVVAQVEDAVQHVEAVCLYIDDRIFSVVERFTNLVTTRRGSGVLNELRTRHLSTWHPSECLLVAGLYTLYLSGRSIRFEEFNGCELSARNLFTRLNQLGAHYCIATAKEKKAPKSPFELGKWVGGMAERLSAPSWLRYRATAGPTFQKRERIHLISKNTEVIPIPPRLIDLHHRWIGHNPLPQPQGKLLLRELADFATDDALASSASAAVRSDTRTKLETLVEEIVSSAITVSGADYGMSSSIRRPGALCGISSLEGVHRRVLELTPKDFFCCIVATAELQQLYGSDLEADVFRAVQARMQFNRWHFIAGNLPRNIIPANRHYFYPPTMPDLAEWSDQYHSGHARARVRFAIRAPGPDVGCPPLRLSKTDFRGFYDVRVVRVKGPPFNLRDLTIVRQHCLWLGVIWNQIVTRCENMVNAREALEFLHFSNGNGLIIPPETSPSLRQFGNPPFQVGAAG